MVTNSRLAQHFIEQYGHFLLNIYFLEYGEDNRDSRINHLQLGRSRYLENRSTYTNLLDMDTDFDEEIKQAIKSLTLDEWVYLGDSHKGACLIRADGQQRATVQGLRQPFQEIFDEGGVLMQLGLVELKGRKVMDGLIINPLQLDKERKAHYQKIHEELVAHPWIQELHLALFENEPLMQAAA